MNSLFSFFESAFGNHIFLICISAVSLVLKTSLLISLVFKKSVSNIAQRSQRYLSLVLLCAIAEDFAWILILTNQRFFNLTSGNIYLTMLFVIRMTWAAYAIEYQALSLFLENLIEHKNNYSLRQKIFITITSTFCLLFVSIAILSISDVQPLSIQKRIQELFTLYALFPLMLSTLYISLKKLNKSTAPRIIKKQLKIVIQILVIPRLLSEFIQFFPFNFFPHHLTSSYAIIGVSTIILSSALYFCARKIIGLRFLNFQSHVQEHHRFNFVDGFKDTLEDLAKASSVYELGHITQAFFKTAFDITGNRVSLHLRTLNPHETTQKVFLSDTQSQVEAFLSNPHPELEKCINKVKILIYDEIDFNNFYDPSYADKSILTFLDTINADIFLPIYKNQTIIGYIIVERYARMNEFYSNIERDEMLVFASYLSNIINLIQNRNLESLIYQEKELKEELYRKHQEINQYKESIHSFLKNHKHKDIGIIFYKNRQFVFANQAAKEIIKINLNTHLGSPLTKSLKTIAEQVEEYKSPQGCITKNNEG